MFSVFHDLAMAQVISSRSSTANSQVLLQVNQCIIFGGKSGNGTAFSSGTSFFPRQIYTPLYLFDALTRRTNGRSLRSYQKSNAL
jgi:hypothetical protein